MLGIKDIAVLLIKQRKKLGIEQTDMYMRIGMKQQQYQRIEAGSDLKLSTLLRVLEGLDLELSITAKGEKMHSVSSCQNIQNKSEYSFEDDKDDLDFWFGSDH
ncbi:helix-turn-helix domain-containing protein [Photobacterium leiognathi]|uniref:helix-turn-helix domain-containing protein n=1 Tax=Photobacterium leiognathi TaxID=553611 RepID=UPI002980E008|nr:helix-turn-helix transcriptional regulator [Photobacterium leiognathi]